MRHTKRRYQTRVQDQLRGNCGREEACWYRHQDGKRGQATNELMNRHALLLKYQCTNIIVHREPRVLLGRLRSSKNFLYSMHVNLAMQGMLYYRAPRYVKCPVPFCPSFLLLYVSPKRLFPPIYEIDSFDLFADNPLEDWHALKKIPHPARFFSVSPARGIRN